MSCLKTCDPKKSPYCITQKLIAAVKGDTREGLIFTGSNSYRIKSIISVKKLIDELLNGIYNA
jgi:hypothetical protein